MDTRSVAEIMAEMTAGRRWARNYTGVWHLNHEGTTRTFCAARLRARGIERKQALGAEDVACERCAKVAPTHDATEDLPRGRRAK